MGSPGSGSIGGGSGAGGPVGGIPTTRRDLSRELLRVARPVLAPLAISVVCRLLALLAGVALFGVGGWAVASAAGGAPGAGGASGAGAGAGAAWSIATTAWVLVALALAKGLLRYFEQFSGHYVAFRSLALLRNHFYDRLEPQAPSRTEGAGSGDLLSRVTKDVDRIEVFFAHTLAPGATAVIAPVAVLVYLGAAVSWWSAVGLAPFLVLVGLVVPRWGAGSTDAAAGRLRAERGRLAQHVTDSVQGVREVLAFNHQAARAEQMGVIEGRIDEDLRVGSRHVALRRGVNQALVAAGVLVAMAVAGRLYSEGAVTIGQVGLAVGVALGSFAPVLAVEDFSAELDQAFASARRVFAITERASLVPDPAVPSTCDGTGDIEVDEVSFRYPVQDEGGAVDEGGAGGPVGAEAGTGAPAGPRRSAGAEALTGMVTGARRAEPPSRPLALDRVTVRIPAGRVTAVVGTSGSGKSTLAAMVDRMWDVDSGSVRIGGVDVRDLTQHRLRELVALAPQRPYVFNDTVRVNLLLAAPGATPADLQRVCAQVGLDDWLAAEPDGLDTGVGEMGERLSGGQRQRLALARTLLRAAPITILDEATSQLDRDTEARVLAGIREATRGRTLVVIAHRISTVRDADRIIVIDAGRIAEVGTYEELMARGGALAALVGREAE